MGKIVVVHFFFCRVYIKRPSLLRKYRILTFNIVCFDALRPI